VIEDLGGTVKREFKYAKGLAATIPYSGLKVLSRTDNVKHIARDVIRTLAGNSNPSPNGQAKGFGKKVPMGDMDIDDINKMDDLIKSGAGFDVESAYKISAKSKLALDDNQVEILVSELGPNTYANPTVMNAGPVWGSGNLGQGSIVAVIDTGVWGGHFSLSGSLVGCDDLSSDVGTGFEGCSSPDNHWHGSHVASTIAGHGALLFAANHPIAKGIAQHSAPLAQASSIGYPKAKILPVLGMAPFSSIYGVKVFDHTGGGVNESTIIASIEHVIDLKLSGAADIDVINMSLGGPTFYDGRDLEDQTIDAATEAGIVVVTAAGNDGPSSQTVGSPGSADTSIAVGAIAETSQMRTFWDLEFHPGAGHQLFVSNTPQMVYFSSRGQTADGRDKPSLSATGAFVLAALPSSDSPDGIGFSSGTSMSSPAVAGTAALLNTWSEANGDLASPLDIRQALESGAVPIPKYSEFEQGAGFNNAGNAMAALMADGSLGDMYAPLGPAPAMPSPPEGMDLDLLDGESTTFRINNLKPGELRHYYLKTTSDSSKITLDVSGVRTKRNPLRLNSFEVHIKTGTRSFEHYYISSANVWPGRGTTHFEISDRSTTRNGNVSGGAPQPMLIQPGYTRISIENDWTSAGPMSGTFKVAVEDGGNPVPLGSIPGSINTGEEQFVVLDPAGPFVKLMANLSWENNWEAYPTSDLELIVAGLDAGFNLVLLDLSGASFNSPEGSDFNFNIILGDPATIEHWLYVVNGFQTNGLTESYQLDFFPPAPTP